MSIMGQSLSQDATDRYTHRWAFATLLLLTIITLLLPLTPSLTLTRQGQDRQHTADPSRGQKTLPVDDSHDFPEYKARCWCPPQFTSSMVVYTNSICSSALNALTRGRNYSEASLWETVDDLTPTDPDNQRGALEPFTASMEDTTDGKESSESSEASKLLVAKSEDLQRQTANLSSGIQMLVSFKTPLYLFLLALCLRFPRALQSLVSTCCGSFNVEQTISAVQASQSMDSSSRQGLKDELSMCLSKFAGKSTALLYLLMKLLVVVVVCVEVAVVSHGLLAETDGLGKELDTVQAMAENDTRLSSQLDSREDDTMTTTVARSTGSPPDFTGQVLLCDLRIRKLQNLQSFTVQCLFTSHMAYKGSDGATTSGKSNFKKEMDKEEMTSPVPGQFQQEKRVVLLYKALFTGVLALLVVLALCTIVSLITWLGTLLLPSCRPARGLPSDVCMDVVFMVSMAWANASPVVAVEIARLGCSSSRSRSDGKEAEMSVMD